MGDTEIQPPKGGILPQTPRSVAFIAYAALAFLFVASTAAGYFNGSNRAYLINIVLTAGLFFIVLGFDRIARSKSPFWRMVGNTLLSAVLTAVAILFIVILYYIPTGQPSALNNWFRPDFRVEPPKNVDFSFRSFNWIAAAEASETSAEGRDRFSPYRSKVVGLGPQVATKTVRWDPNVSADTTIEISLRRKGEMEFSVLSDAIPAQAGAYEIPDLVRGRVYEVRIVAYRQGVSSEPQIKCSGVGANETLLQDQPFFPEYVVYYTGEIDCDGKLNGQAKLIYERFNYQNMLNYGPDYIRNHDVVPRWAFSGDVERNRPKGQGTLKADQYECIYAVSCLSTCKGTFEQESIIEGECRIQFRVLVLSSDGLADSNIGTIYGGGEYLGHVGTASGPRVRIGPFKTTFEGVGVLQARDPDYSALYVGPWEGGRLGLAGRFEDNTEVGKLSWFKVDLLHKGWTINHNGCELRANSGKEKSSQQRVFVDCLSIAVSSTKGGFSLQRSKDGKGFVGTLRIDGKDFDMSTTYPDDESLCFHADEFTVAEHVVADDWELLCSVPSRSCSLKNTRAMIEFRASYPVGAWPSLQVFAQNGDLSKATINGVAVQPWAINPQEDDPISLGALITLSRMCGGGEVAMSNVKAPVSDPCRVASIMFARLMQCDMRVR
ncbi:fibronectin type III domain-containing protein [Rhizobium laguerreae]|uniref:fibronectin type III domain-containing protein n=1 Tax=Rhizobium laguerreae TaxID=1076926 RepID=UPI001C924E7F|nr:fibronectin type III domain-containing protein [Rhizobium laguerreae]MBY3557344.1 hypothetical protein [Rhizobium laguerreae]